MSSPTVISATPAAATPVAASTSTPVPSASSSSHPILERKISETIDLTGGATPNVSNKQIAVSYLHCY